MAITNPGGLLNSVPSVQQMTLQSNYIDFTAQATAGWAQQYLPELMEQEAEVFGNRTVSGFLSQVGAEMPMTSDQVVWSEQGRLHLSYGGTTAAADVINILTDADGNSVDAANEAGHGIRIGDTVIVSSAAETVRCYVTAAVSAGTGSSSTTHTITAKPYSHATLAAAGIGTGTVAVNVFVYGSEFLKGTDTNSTGANEPIFKSFTNKPIIMKDKYHVSGSDTAQIGWVEVAGESGVGGYLWYLKAEGETRTRFTDYLEMTMIEAEKAVGSSGAEGALAAGAGTEGLLAAISSRGNVETGGIVGTNTAAQNLATFDLILKELDNQGAIEENMLFLGRGHSLLIDDMLAGMNSYGTGGTSYGVFGNEEDMAINLGFSGFRRASYDFYKTDWKYLNDKGTRGGILDANKLEGILVPAGVTSVYDEVLGKNLKRPFLHVRYRASQMDDRRLKTWTTGSVGGNITSSIDKMEVHYLSERCLITQGANNFMLLKS
tara:strand:+ start:5010 stop:6479 length:1470 start_codon:yes stop_codon:yes gene_type:complete